MRRPFFELQLRSSPIMAMLVTAAAVIGNSPLRADPGEGLEAVRAADLRLAVVMHRLTIANAHRCPRQMPGTGFLLHTLEQYPSALHGHAHAVFGFEATLSVEAVVPGSPADQAGLKANDGIAAINAEPVRPARSAEAGTSLRRDEIERHIADLPPDQPVYLQILRSGQHIELRVAPIPACRTRYEVRFGANEIAVSDGETIQISDGFMANFDDSALAVIAAHELAHTALEHRRHLEAKGVNYGLFASFGRNGTEIRVAEEAADRASVSLLRDAGYDPRIAPAFWRGAGRKLGGGIFRSRTHPSPEERAKAMEAEVAREQP